MANLHGSELLERLRLRAHRASRAHYLASNRNASMNARLGIPAAVLSSVVGTSIFASIGSDPSTLLTSLAGIIAICSAALISLQTMFGFSERAEKHRLAAAQYAHIKRKLDLLAAQPTPITSLQDIPSILDEINALEREAPDVPDRFYDQSRREEQVDDEGV